MKLTIIKGLVIGSILLASGCAKNTQMYTWGQYEELIYEFHNAETNIEPQKHIEMLQNTIASATKLNKKVGPGIFAHLGMLYSSVGEADKARAALEEEKKLYPESATFIDGMFKRAQTAK